MMTKTKGLSQADRQLLGMFEQNVSNYDFADEAPTIPVVSNNEKLKVGKIAGNPAMLAQFDVSISLKYFTVAAGVFTSVAHTAIAAVLQTQLAAFVFGQADFASGFRKAISQFPVTGGWSYDVPFIYGRDYPNTNFGVIDATVKGQLQRGDMVIPFWATTAGPVNTMCFVIIRCSSVGYATLLDAISSDRFWLNNIRYVLTDITAAGLEQYNNAIENEIQSLFGRYTADQLSPDSFKQPEQFQQGIVDIPIKKGIDKQNLLGTYINYDSIFQKWSIFVNQLSKITA